MEADKILDRIFSQNKPSLRQQVKRAIAALPPQNQQVVRDRFNDVVFCVLTLTKYHRFCDRDAIDGTIAAIDFSNPNFVLDFDAIATNAPKRYIANPLPN